MSGKKSDEATIPDDCKRSSDNTCAQIVLPSLSPVLRNELSAVFCLFACSI